MYELFSIVQVNLIGILLMAITLISLVKNFRSGIVADRLFFLLSLSVMFVCFFEIMGYVFDGRSFYGAIALNRFFNSILFAVNPFPAFLWALYAHCKVYRDEASLFRAAKVLSLPLLTFVLLSILNLFTDVF